MIGFVFMNHRHTATIALATILVALTGCTGYTERIDTARADATREVRDYKYLQYPNLYLDRIKDARAEWEIEELLTAATTENQERETGYWECVETLGSPAGTWQAETGDPNTPGTTHLLDNPHPGHRCRLHHRNRSRPHPNHP